MQPENEKGRLEALENYQILDSLNEEEFDRITELASIICDTPIALVTLLDEKRQWFKSKVGLQLGETPRTIAFCQHTIMQDTLFEVQDTENDARFSNNPLVTGEPHIRFYAGYPLTDPSGFNLGTLCVIDRVPRYLTEKQKKALLLLSQEVIGLIVERRKKEELKNFENLFKLSPDLICISGTDGYFKKINPALQQLTGIDASQLTTTSFYDLVHTDDLSATVDKIKLIRQGIQLQNFVARIRASTGAYRSIEWTASPEKSTGNLFAVGRDFTEDLIKESKLSDSESRLRAFFENSLGLMSTHDLEGKFLSVNPAGAEMLGYTSEELIGKTLYDLIPKGRHFALSAYLQQVQSEGSAKGQVTMVHKEGFRQTWMFSNALETSADGEMYVIANGVDITERFEMETNLYQTKKMLEETNQVARIGGWQIDLENQKLYWTSVTKEIHRVSPDFEPDINTAINFYKEGESRDLITIAVDNALQHGIPWNHELQIVDAEGNELWVRAIGKTEWKDGICHRLYGTFQDIDDKKKTQIEVLKSKAILSAFVQHAPASVAMFDTEMRYIATSNNWLEDYQLHDKPVIGVSHYDLFPNITAEGKQRHQRILAGAVERNDQDSFILLGEENRHYVAWEMRPWYQLDGSIGGIMIFTQDVTEAIQQREQLTAAKNLAEEASMAKSEFLANMSHEIRTPLNGVIGFTDLVLETDLSDTQQQYLTIVNQSANALLSIINDILDFSKIEAGKLELDIERINLYELSTQTTDIVSYQVQNKGLEMLLHLPDGLPDFIWVDVVRLKQILTNLLTNAAKFTEKGEIELSITTISRNDSYATLRFCVRDTGIGIKPDKQSKIFEAFSQEDGSTTKKYGGTGLGLTISNQLLSLMDSQLQLESVPDKGSDFFFEITVQAANAEPVEYENLDKIKNVMIVDDNQSNRRIISDILSLKGIASVQAKNGYEAIQQLASGKQFDAALIDYHMPYWDGLETITKMRQLLGRSSDRLPIILLWTSSDKETVKSESEALAVSQRLLKPIKAHDLYTALSQLYAIKSEPVLPVKTFATPPANSNQYTILIVEDNPVNMLLTQTIVKRILPNATLLKALNGLQAVDTCKEVWPDLVLMDMQMPEMNGLEATRQIRLMNKGTLPIVALTAGTLKEEREKCLAAGMDDFIAKPIIEKVLRATLSNWLGYESPEIPSDVTSTDDATIHFDRDQLIKYAGNDHGIVAEVIHLTKSELTDSLDNLKMAIDKEDLAMIKGVGHKLYGTSATAGLPVIARVAIQLEHSVSYDTLIMQEIYERLTQETRHVITLLDAEKQNG
ncbi:hybrid sensor histidine kinase/response regulator [Dyadobacter luteus]|uniref:Sensory/regulatory protein RpfC n=1 Tax=Dyadobacter luteus TaxID=2259619 RepID=A0A3D8YEN2_9BACT|nr:response regulator [Dyadobacter luteus]REA63032.1 hybrid sensor histidine kinase/response regulator [Dyadobacter luteus]